MGGRLMGETDSRMDGQTVRRMEGSTGCQQHDDGRRVRRRDIGV